MVEALYGLHCHLVHARRSGAEHLGIAGEAVAFQETFFRFPIPGAADLVAREQAVLHDGATLIAGEYGEPGARILVATEKDRHVHEPYADDPGVYHIHALCALGQGLYLCTTGDSRKYTDLLRIDRAGCRIVSRLERRLGGHTAMLGVGHEVWIGTDFSERPNFLRNLTTNERYFLPGEGLKTFVIHLELAEACLLVYTKRLGTHAGYRFTFDLCDRRFSAIERLSIDRCIRDGPPL